MLLSNMANEWCGLATSVVRSNAMKTAGINWKMRFILYSFTFGCALLGLRLAFSRQRGVVDRIPRLARQVRKKRRAPRIPEPFFAGQLRTRCAVLQKVVAARLTFPVLDAMAGGFEFLRATKRVDRADRF